MNFKISSFLPLVLALALVACSDDDSSVVDTDPSDYTGTAFITQGVAETITSNLLSCANGRDAGIGTITDTEGNEWTVPAVVHYTDSSFPFASELSNPCSGNQYSNADAALNALDGDDIVAIDSDGEVFTAYVFADNYFEMYVNGVAVGKDRVPFTQFNSSLVRFKVSRPFTIAMKLVDWEENLGLGSEDNQGSAYHPGDGGMVAVVKDASGSTVAITNEDWKAQTFYTAPIKDLTCPSEEGTTRLTDGCNEDGTDDGTQFYALHWEVPTGWMNEEYDDASWPAATTYTNATIGVDNKSAYTNFTDIFDASSADALFIWSTNVVLDNEVIVRYTVE